MVVEENGIQKVVYLDNPATEDQTNYGKSLVQAANDIIEKASEWLGDQEESYIDAIYVVAGVSRLTEYNFTVKSKSPCRANNSSI